MRRVAPIDAQKKMCRDYRLNEGPASDLPGDIHFRGLLWQNGVMTDLGTLPAGHMLTFGSTAR